MGVYKLKKTTLFDIMKTVKKGVIILHCLQNIERINYPKELVYKITKLYTFRGKDFYYEDVFKQHMNAIIKNTIIDETIYAGKLLNLNVSEARMKYVVKNDSDPKTKDEQVLRNLKSVFTLIQSKGTDFELSSNEILKLVEVTFKGVVQIDYKSDYVVKEGELLPAEVSRRDKMTQEFTLYQKALTEMHIEATQIATDLFIDMLEMECFERCNSYIALLTLYCLLFRERFNVFKYKSFFKSVYTRKEQFDSAINAAKYGWSDGYANTAVLNNIIIDIMLEGYEQIEADVQGHEFDKNLSKIDNVEGVIMKLGKVFTKDEIKKACPTLSESTIFRALKKLKDEGKIAPNGTGRSATWTKLVEDEIITKGINQQLTLFDLMSDGS